MNTEKKVKDTYDAYSGASKEIVKLISLLVGTGHVHSEVANCIEFEEVPDKEFTVRCYDKLAVGLSTDGTVFVILNYPSRFDVTVEQMKQCLQYRGIQHLLNAHETYYRAMTAISDIMMSFGKVKYIRHIK
jgi:hypothetical protein